MIRMVVKFCTCCNKDIDLCRYQRTMREFGLSETADLLTYELVIPEAEHDPAASYS